MDNKIVESTLCGVDGLMFSNEDCNKQACGEGKDWLYLLKILNFWNWNCCIIIKYDCFSNKNIEIVLTTKYKY